MFICIEILNARWCIKTSGCFKLLFWNLWWRSLKHTTWTPQSTWYKTFAIGEQRVCLFEACWGFKHITAVVWTSSCQFKRLGTSSAEGGQNPSCPFCKPMYCIEFKPKTWLGTSHELSIWHNLHVFQSSISAVRNSSDFYCHSLWQLKDDKLTGKHFFTWSLGAKPVKDQQWRSSRPSKWKGTGVS